MRRTINIVSRILGMIAGVLMMGLILLTCADVLWRNVEGHSVPGAYEYSEVDLVALYDRTWVALGDNLAGLKAARFVRDRVAAEKIVYKVNTVLGLAEAVESARSRMSEFAAMASDAVTSEEAEKKDVPVHDEL